MLDNAAAFLREAGFPRHLLHFLQSPNKLLVDRVELDKVLVHKLINPKPRQLVRHGKHLGKQGAHLLEVD